MFFHTPVQPSGDAFAVVDGHGAVVSWSPGAQRLLGHTAEQARGLPAADLLFSPADAAALAERRPAAEPVSGDARLRHRDGHAVEVVLRVHPTPTAERQQWLVQAQSAEAARAYEVSQALLRGLFDESPFIIDVFDTDLRYLAQNRSIGRTPGFAENVTGRTLREVAPPGLLDMDALEARQRRALETGKALIGQGVRGRDPRDPDRDVVWSESILPLRGRAGDIIGLVHLVVDMTEEERARERLDLVNAASTRIGSTLDVLHTAKELTDVAVPWFADYAYVNLLDPVFSGEELVSGPVPESVPMRRAAETMLPGEPGFMTVALGEVDAFSSTPGSPTARALAAGRPVQLTGQELDAELMTLDLRRAAAMRERGIHSWLVVPMRARGATLGVVVFARFARAHSFEADDILLAEEFVARAGVCIDNASRYTRERATATALQRSLLPQRMPALGGVETASRYVAASGHVVLGGAWFDVIALSGARVALVAGDAGGHGLDAAVTMARLRTAVRTLAELDFSADELLSHLDGQVTRFQGEVAAGPAGEFPASTCVYAIFDPLSGRCELASAGGPLPVLIAADGEATVMDIPVGSPLGTSGDPYESREVKLADGDTLVLSTAEFGEPLPRTFTASEGLAGFCDDVLRRLHPEHLQDDAALLLARVRTLTPERQAAIDLASAPESVGKARAWAARQLLDWDLADLDFTTELLVSELVTNAIRYGTSPITLRLIRDRSLICEVSDGSSTSPHARRALETDEGGRGLFMVAQFSELWGTRYHTRGKTIWAEQPLP
ncbi:SpoIIE family protein phosphatase [Streptomyces sp. NPDC051976]|uniref:SpoIIE family protein phosphatase n=1 Tax=Streptomyces sp. NPDC051976 TaxID=3154947 RepID=UPI00344A1D9A